MGADYYSYAVIGVEIDQKKLYQKPINKKAFEHDYPKTMKFCPNTGNKLWEEVEEPIPEWDDEDELGEYKVYFSTDDTRCFIGVIVCESGPYKGEVNFVQFPDDLEDKKQKLKDFLTPLGLWDESKFGVYSIMRCSY